MIDLYVRLVKAKRRTCNQDSKTPKPVPEHLCEAVLEALKAEGYDGDGNKL